MAALCPPWAGSCRRGREGSSLKGSSSFLSVMGGSGSWQELTVVARGKRRRGAAEVAAGSGRPWLPPAGWRWPSHWVPAPPLLDELQNAPPEDENYLAFNSKNT